MAAPKKRKVLLVNSKIGDGLPWVPLSLAYLASYLRAKMRADVRILDKNFPENDEGRLRAVVREFGPDVVGVTGMTVQSVDAMNTGRIAKEEKPDAVVVYGGTHFTFIPQDGLKHGDICVIGEGEVTFLEICRGKDWRKIKGIVFKDRRTGAQVRTAPREFIRNLDKVPFPAYDLLDVPRYSDNLITGERAISMMTGRGCPYNCVFCASPRIWQRKVRVHSIKYVKKHIDYLVKHYGMKNLRVMDDTFTVSRQRVLDFCDMVEDGGYKLNMTFLTRVNHADPELFRRMHAVGFSIVAYGVEAGNERILRLVNKGIRKDQVRAAVKTAKFAGLSTELLFMVGNIGENEGTIAESIELAKEVNPPNSNYKPGIYNWFQYATPFPGSVFYDIAESKGKILSSDWEVYDHQNPVFVPKGITAEKMIELRNRALAETNYPRLVWILIRGLQRMGLGFVAQAAQSVAMSMWLRKNGKTAGS